MQSYDFYHLHEKFGCRIQFGGDDQWSNMLGGTELIRKKTGKDAYVLTIPLLTTSDGVKMGKTVKGALWLDENKTSPFDFYQYWRNIEDASVDKTLKMITFLPIEEIEAMEKWDDSRINEKKEILAFEITKLVHGEEKARQAQQAARALFSGEGDDSNMPTSEIEAIDIGICDLLVKVGLTTSKGEAKRLIEQGGLSIDGEKVSDPARLISSSDIQKGFKIKKGKKVFHKVISK